MKLQSIKRNFHAIWAALAVCVIVMSASVAQAQYLVYSDFTTRPAGPNSVFSMYVALSPADVDVSGFSIRVGYDSSKVVLESVSDNTGHPEAEAVYTMGTPQPLTGVANVDTYVPVIMDTAFNLPTPGNLVQLNFRTTANFDNAQNRVWLHLSEHNFDGIVDGDYEELENVQYQGPTLVPVTLSGFSLE